MDDEKRTAISEYMRAVEKLQRLNVIKSPDYNRDVYSALLSNNLGAITMPIISNNCPHHAPLTIKKGIGDEILAVLGTICHLKNTQIDGEIHVYKIDIKKLENSSYDKGESFKLTEEYFMGKKADLVIVI